MSSFRESIKEQLLENRPNLSASSVKTYTSTLANLLTKIPTINQNKLNVNMFTTKHKQIMKFMVDFSSSKRKSILSALYIVTGNMIYNEKMKEDMSAVYDDYKTQKKTAKEEKNWIEWEDVLQLHSTLTREAGSILLKPRINNAEINKLNRFILLSVYTMIPPRRIQDMQLMQIRNYDSETDNHYNIDTGDFVFHKYKTAGVYGSQTININGSKLQSFIEVWMDINDSDFLIVSERDHDSGVKGSNLTSMLNSIFDSNVSVSMLRKSFLSYTYKDIDLLKMEKLATQMGHSSSTALGKYVKK